MVEARCRVCGETFQVETLTPGLAAASSAPVCPACETKLNSRTRAEREPGPDNTTVMRPKGTLPSLADLGRPEPDAEARGSAFPGLDLRGEFPDARATATPASTPPPLLKTAPAPVVGKLFGNYEILAEVSRGSFGVVYRAQQRGLDRVAALKVLLAGTHASPEAVARFQREARAVARLKHPNIVPIYDIGEQDGHHYFAMEFVEGNSLSSLIARRAVAIPEALALCEALADAIESAHGAGVIHRDIKPSNILVDRKGLAHLTDFGLAKQTGIDTQYTQSGTTLGTPAYMPPEQARGEVSKIDARSDVYALGAVLYEMLTGAAPFSGRSLLEVVIAVINEPVRPPRQINPKIHRDIQTMVMKCLEKDSRNRYLTAAELRDDIRRFRSGEAIRAKPVGRLRLTGRLVQKHSFFLGAVATVLLAVGYSLWSVRKNELKTQLARQADQERQAREEQDRQEQERQRLLSEERSSQPEWKLFWGFPVKEEWSISREDRRLFRGFVRPLPPGAEEKDPAKINVPDWDGVNGQPARIPIQAQLTSPMEMPVMGDLDALITFQLAPEAAGKTVRIGLQSKEGGIPYVLCMRPGYLTLVGPVDMQKEAVPPALPQLQVKAEKRGGDLVAGAYKIRILREGIQLRFELFPPPPGAPIPLRVWDIGLSHWKFKNTQLTIREPAAGFQVLSVEVRCKTSPERSDKITQALNFFHDGEYNKAEFNFKAILESRDSIKDDQDRLKVARACYYLGLLQDLFYPKARAESPYYAEALDLLEKCQAVPKEKRAIEALIRLNRIEHAFARSDWNYFDAEMKHLARVEGALAGLPAAGTGLGEPYGWELQPVLLASLKTREHFTRSVALFERMRLPPGSRLLDQASATLAMTLVSFDRIPELKKLQQAYPAGCLLPAFTAAIQRALTQWDNDALALEILGYSVREFQGLEVAEPLDQAAGSLLAYCVRARRFPNAEKVLSLRPRPAVLPPLGQALAVKSVELNREDLDPVLALLKQTRTISESAWALLSEQVLAGLAKAPKHELTVLFYALLRAEFRGDSTRLFPIAVGALEKMNEEARKTALAKWVDSVRLAFQKDPLEEHQARLESVDLYLALGQFNAALKTCEALYQELLQEFPVERGPESDLLARTSVRLGALRTFKQAADPAEIWDSLMNKAIFPEEAHLAGKFLLGLLKEPDLEAELRRVGAPSLYSEAEWDLLRGLRRLWARDLKGFEAFLKEAAKKSEAVRGWPSSLAKLPAQPADPGAEPPRDLSP